MNVPNWEGLSGHDAEILVRDLLSAEWKTHVESFRRGPDGGIDLRVLGPSGPPLNLARTDRIVVQVKHYPDASLARLRTAFRKEAKRLLVDADTRYIAVTTAKLSVKGKQTIANLFQPPLSESDILGREDIEALLTKHEAIRRLHLRLWLTETTELHAVLHARETLLRDRVLEQISRQASVLVTTRHLKLAEATLQSEGAVIIAGPPGVGKTCTALLLLAAQIKEGWELIVAGDSLDDAESLRNMNNQQVLYYDDFLGSSLQTAFLSGKNEDRRLLELLDQAFDRRNLRLVLTTREYVLASARRIHSRLSEQRIDLTRILVDASDLDVFERAEILYRHIYFSACRIVLYRDRTVPEDWVPVLTHPSFNPRLIRLYVQATSRMLVTRSSITPRVFIANLRRSFDDPSELWRTIYDEHLTPLQRQLLQTCATIPHQLVLADLLELTRQWAEGQGERKRSDAEWRAELRVLDGDFLSISAGYKQEEYFVTLANPSVATYVLYRLSLDIETILDILNSAALFEQVELIWSVMGVHFVDGSTNFDIGRDLRAERFEEQSHEILGTMLTAMLLPRDMQRLRESFKKAILRTFRVGIYANHPSLGSTPRRWTFLPTVIDRRLPAIYWIAGVLNLANDDELAYSVIRGFADYLGSGKGSGDSALACIRLLYSADLPVAWSHHKDVVRLAADSFFLGGLTDGTDFSDAIDYLSVIGDGAPISELRPRFLDAVKSYPSTEAARFRVAGNAEEIDVILEEFSEAASGVGVDVRAELEALSRRLIALSKLPPKYPKRRRRPQVFREDLRPTRSSPGDISVTAAVEAAQIFCQMRHD
jgi:hypothetical protein